MAGEVRSRNERLLAPSSTHHGRGDLCVCYVCGAHRANCQLRIRPFANEPFFPFLEHHEAASGSYIHADGVVDSCRVCHAFLIQQWVAFDKNNTPIPKRLYWLKRPDAAGQMRKHDGPMISTHHPAPHPVRDELYSRLNFGNLHGLPPPQEDTGRNNGIIEPLSTVSTSGINGDASKRRQVFNSWDIEIPTVAICYGCGVSVPQQAVHVVHTSHWSKSESPYFPCILAHPAPGEARPVDQFGRVLMCESCAGYLLRQWQAHELENVPLHERIYHLRTTAGGGSTGSVAGELSPVSTSHDRPTALRTACFLCGGSVTVADAQIIRARKFNTVDPFYPFLEKHAGASGSLPVSTEGAAQVCGMCNADLDEQWNAHELMGTPLDKRVYRIPNQGGSKSLAGHQKSDDVKVKSEEKVRKHKYEVCYLCSDITSPLGTRPVNTGRCEGNEHAEPEQSDAMYFPFLAKVKRPHKARKVDKSGNVLVCIPCHDHLQQQWTDFQKRDTPQDERHYHARTTSKVDEGSKPADPPSVPPKKPSMPLADTSKQDSVCFLCSARCKPRDHYRLHSFPRRNQHDQESIPFFPFLMKHSPAPNAAQIGSDGVASVCKYCYLNLNTQWHDYESSSDFTDSNRWLRRYNLSGFVCFVCAQVVKRKDICKVSVKEYPCLLRHERPTGGIILEDNSVVITCPTCDVSLYSQKAAFDHLQVPEDKRAYQLTHSLASEEEKQETRSTNSGRKLESVIVIDSDSEGERDGTRRHHGNTVSSAPPASMSPRNVKENRPDSTGHHAHAHAHHHLPPGPSPNASKPPPPLTVTSAANSSKANRTTATVTPFSQSAASTITVTSGNGGAATNQALAATRTSSFAAALRKLAKQANDNGPDEISPRTSPASTTRSSASTPSKYHLGPSPLVAPTSSPPVVTIAPTHTTSSSLDTRRELERRSQSNSVDRSLGRSLPGEGASSIWRGKESPSLGLGPRRPLAQLPTKSEEMAGRGFQPYRAGEDPIRPPTAAPHPLASYDPAAMAAAGISTYPFHPAFLTPSNLQYHAFRPEEHFERYAAYPGLRPPFLPLGSPHAPMFPHPAMSPLFTSLRYPGDLAAMQVPHISPGSMSFGGLGNPITAAEREKVLQEQQRERERERRAEELRLEQSRERSRSEREGALLHQDRGRIDERRYSSSPARDSVSSRRPQSHSSSLGVGKPSPQDPVGPLPLLKKAEREDRWGREGDKHRHPSRSSGGGGSGGRDDRHSQDSPTNYSRDGSSHDASRYLSDRERKAHHERELLLQQDRRLAERHESEHRERREREEHSSHHHHHHHPPPLTSLHGASHGSAHAPSHPLPPHEAHPKHNSYNNHRTVDYDRLPPSRTLHSDSKHADRSAHSDHRRVQSSSSHSDGRSGSASSGSKPPTHVPLNSNMDEKESLRHAQTLIKNAAAPIGPYDLSQPHAEFNRHFHEFYRNQHRRGSDALPGGPGGPGGPAPPRPSAEPVTSKLDLEEKRKSEERRNGVYASSESEEDSEEELEDKRERYRRRMIRIVRRSRLKMDPNEKKSGFLTSMGLISHKQRREVRREQLRKRMRIYGEDMCCLPRPAKVAKVTPQPALLPPAAPLTQEDFQKELNYPHKCRFLRSFGLDTLTQEKKQAITSAKKAVDADRDRRLRREQAEANTTTTTTPNSADAHSPAIDAMLQERLQEAKEGGGAPVFKSHPGLPPKPLKHLTVDSNPPSSSSPLPHPGGPTSSAGSTNHNNVHSPSLETPSSTADTPSNQLLKTAPPVPSGEKDTSTTHLKKEIKQEVMNGEMTGYRRRPEPVPTSLSSSASSSSAETVLKQPSPFTISSFLNTSRHNSSAVADGFAQEFHQSVLRSTQEKLNQKKGASSHSSHNDSSRRDYLTIPATTSASARHHHHHQAPHQHPLPQPGHHHHHHHQPSATTSSSSSSLLSSMTSSSSSTSQNSRHKPPSSHMYGWPGWEVVSESYHRYLAEQQSERSMLLDHLTGLRHQTAELNGNAELLARRKNELTERMYEMQREYENYLREMHLLRQRTLDLDKAAK